jgi:rhodanese-related sulfurtransferase
MEQYLEFAANHVFLVGAWMVVFSALVWHFVANPGGKFNIEAVEATNKINHEEAVVVDVRSMNEFKDGHIINAENIPLNGLNNNLKALEKHKSKPIIAVCRSGSRSGAACSTLRKAGFENVYNLRGGMMAWESANLPVKRNKK